MEHQREVPKLQLQSCTPAIVVGVNTIKQVKSRQRQSTIMSMFQGTKQRSDSVVMSIPDTEGADVPPIPPSTSEEDMDTTPVSCSTPIQLSQQHETIPQSPIVFVEQPPKKRQT